MDIMPILLALGVVACVGLVLGIVLALASKFFAVDEDEKVKLVREALPGANCGACGYTGCDGYAEAVAKGEAEPNLCIPGGSSTAAQLSIILGVKIQELEPKVAFVACGGDKYRALDVMFANKFIRKLNNIFDDNMGESLDKLVAMIDSSFGKDNFVESVKQIALIKKKLY